MSFREPGPLLKLYRGLSPALWNLVGPAATFDAKLARGVRGRQGLDARIAAAAATIRGGVWFHVTSVGEYEQARPLIATLRDRPDPPPVAVTHFSPSGYDYAIKQPLADVHEYLPFDHPAQMERLVRLWRPRLLVFVKFDCWPNQVLAADRAGVPLVLLAGSLQPASARLKTGVRKVYRDLFDRFAHLGVSTPEDKTRFADELKVSCPITVTGDTRVEQVILRYEAAREGDTAARLKALGGRLLVLGSTWPADEKIWLPILAELVSRVTDLRIILTPHEPSAERLAALEKSLANLGLASRRLSELMDTANNPGEAPPVILTDSVGVLAEIYRAGHLTYVGGSFTTGVHNTMEPAVGRMPVLFGPRIDNAEEAGLLVRRGAGFVVETPAAALETASALLLDPDRLAEAGRAARQVVLDQRGATKRSLAVIEPWL